MNDIDHVRAFRADLPPADPNRLAPGRAALLAEASRRPPRFRPSWRLALAATAAAASVATAIVVLGDDGPVELRPVGAAQFLERAAAAAEKQPDTRPGPHQWIYSRTYQPQPATTAGAQPPDYMTHVESWTRFDGLKTATYEPTGKHGAPELRINDEKWVKDDTDSEERTPAQWYDYFRTLPTDPAELLAFMTRRADAYMAEWKKPFPSVDARDQWVFRRLSGFLNNGAGLPDSMRATVYRAIGRMPGVEVRQGTADVLGRKGTSVIRAGVQDKLTEEFIIADGTYAYLGMRVVANADITFPAPTGGATPSPSPVGPEPSIKAGTVLNEHALEASGIVDAPGERP